MRGRAVGSIITTVVNLNIKIVRSTEIKAKIRLSPLKSGMPSISIEGRKEILNFTLTGGMRIFRRMYRIHQTSSIVVRMR